MAVTHSAAARNDMADAIVALTNAGTTPTLTIHQTSGDTLLVTILLGADFVVSGAVATCTPSVSSGTAVATGTAGYARINASAGTEIFRGSVGTSGTDVVISSTSITTGDTVTLSGNITWTAPL